MYKNIRYENKDQIALITLLHDTMDVHGCFCEDMMDALQKAEDDEMVRVVILKNDGRFFCAGGNLSPDLGSITSMRNREVVHKAGVVAQTLSSMPKPVIALVNGAASGGGANLALSCDFVLVSEKALFCEVFVNINLIPDTGGLWNLVRLVGPLRAKQLCMTGCKIPAEKAIKYGMATELVSSDKLLERGLELAQELAEKPPKALSFIKEICWHLPEMTHASYLEMESSTIGLLCGMEDYMEGINSFLEKRKPQYQGK